MAIFSCIYVGMNIPFTVVHLIYKALRRPCYLTTDDAGIGITMQKGSRAILWDDIESARFTQGWAAFALKDSKSIQIHLFGYPTAQQKELQSLVEQKAQLAPHPKHKGLFIHAVPEIPTANSLSTLPASSSSLQK